MEARSLYADATAVRLFERALAAFAEVPQLDRRALRPAALDVAIALGGLLISRNRLVAAAERFEEALALAENDDARSRAWQSVAMVAYRRGDLAAAAATFELGLDALSADGGLPRARLLSDLAWVRYRREGPAEALDLMRDAAEQLDAAGDLREASAAWDALAIALNDVGKTDEALAASDTAFELCARVEDDRGLRVTLHLHRAPILGRAGRIYEGLAELDRVRRSPGATTYSRSLTYWIETELHQRRGDLDSALAANDRELELLAQIDNARHTAQALARRSVLLAGLGRPRDARVAARDARAAALGAEDPSVGERVANILAGNEAGISRA
jgi:tetratricopeptide (TPR) repeat protein